MPDILVQHFDLGPGVNPVVELSEILQPAAVEIFEPTRIIEPVLSRFFGEARHRIPDAAAAVVLAYSSSGHPFGESVSVLVANLIYSRYDDGGLLLRHHQILNSMEATQPTAHITPVSHGYLWASHQFLGRGSDKGYGLLLADRVDDLQIHDLRDATTQPGFADCEIIAPTGNRPESPYVAIGHGAINILTRQLIDAS